jgi:hypothetical protein
MRDRNQRRYGQDQPWREERRQRYPDEPYGGERGWRSSADERQSHRGRGEEGYRERQGEGWGRGYGYGFSDAGTYRQEPRRNRGWENDARGEGRPAWSGWKEDRSRDWNTGATFGFGREEDVERSGNYAYGSPYGQGDMGTDRAGRGDWRDTDWAVNRPARGRGTWSGDWQLGPSGTDWSTDYAGRGPKDYRRSDDRIREEVCDVFTDDARLDPSDVVVKVEGGEVTLMGSVGSRDQKRRAEELAERVRGVDDVNNQLRVMRADTTSGTPVSPQGIGRGARASSSPMPPSVAHDRERDRDR